MMRLFFETAIVEMIHFHTCDGVDNRAQNCGRLNQLLQYVRFCCQWKAIV